MQNVRKMYNTNEVIKEYALAENDLRIYEFDKDFDKFEIRDRASRARCYLLAIQHNEDLPQVAKNWFIRGEHLTDEQYDKLDDDLIEYGLSL